MMRMLIVLTLLLLTLAAPAAAQPANDECGGAEVIPFAYGVSVQPIDNTTATNSADPVNDVLCSGTYLGEMHNDIWFTWTAGQDGFLTVSTCSTITFDSSIIVYSGGCGALTDVACNGDGAGCAVLSSIIDHFDVTAGTEYHFRVGGYGASSAGTGDMTLEFYSVIPVTNLTCATDQSTGVSEVLMTWDENVFYDQVSIYLDAVDPANLITTVPGVGAGGSNSFNYSPAPDGEHTLLAVGESGGAFAPSAQCFISTACPATAGATLVPVATNLPLGGGVACIAGGLHTDNSYYRAYDLCNNYSVTSNIDVRCVTTSFISNPAAGTTQPVRVRLSIDANGRAVGPLNAMTMFYEEEFQIPYMDNAFYNFVLGTGIIDPDGVLAGSATTVVGCLDFETLVVEIFTPSGMVAGHSLFMGIPDPAQTNPYTDQIGASYISAPACGYTEPVDMASIGFPTSMWIMDVAWDDAGICGCIGDVDGDGIPDECDIDQSPGPDCDANGVLDVCQPDCDGNGAIDECEIAAGSAPDCNSNGIIDDCEYSTAADCNGNGILDQCDLLYGVSEDCNLNAIPDECELDCDGNGIPDDCEMITNDCNDNGIPDECELDCDGNGILDDCELITRDCNANGLIDICEIDAGTTPDCNQNGTPDSCEYSPATDCNANGILDECDILVGISEDCNGNNTPDECDIADGVPDNNGDGVPDSCEGDLFLRGECNGDDAINIGDGIFLLAFLFTGGLASTCQDASDVNDDGGIDIADAINLLAYLFTEGDFPPAPFPTCGVDPTEDLLGCESFGVCP